MSTSPPSAPNYITNIGLGYSIAIALGFLVLLSTILLASYICCRSSSSSPRPFSPNPTASAASANPSNSDGIILPRIIFVAEDDDNESVVVGLDQAVINSYPQVPVQQGGGLRRRFGRREHDVLDMSVRVQGFGDAEDDARVSALLPRVLYRCVVEAERVLPHLSQLPTSDSTLHAFVRSRASLSIRCRSKEEEVTFGPFQGWRAGEGRALLLRLSK